MIPGVVAGQASTKNNRAPTILPAITHWWNFEEASGNRADQVGSWAMVPTGTINQVTDKVGNAATGATLSYLRTSANQASLGDTGFSIFGWFFAPAGTYPTQYAIVWSQLGTSATTNRQANVLFDSTNSQLLFQVSSDGTTGGSTFHTVQTSCSKGVWHFFVARHDPVADTITISVDEGAQASISHSGGVYSGATNPVFIGAANYGVSSSSWPSGAIFHSMGIVSKALTTSESSYIYNFGNGVNYAKVVADAAA
jgi:hypothetical protein